MFYINIKHKTMSLYHGGKKRISKKLAEIIYNITNELENKFNVKFKGYCEPFVGMASVLNQIHDLFKDRKPKLKYKANDINKSVILMWKAVQNGWVPPVGVSEKKYNMYKKHKEPSAEKGYIGHQYSFGGQYFQGYVQKYNKFSKYESTSKNIVSMGKLINDVQFYSGDYTRFSNLKGWIIYCDPPYSVFNRYYDAKGKLINFDTDKFWNWARNMSKNNLVFISEYIAPKDTHLVFSSAQKLTGMKPKERKREERLYLMDPTEFLSSL